MHKQGMKFGGFLINPKHLKNEKEHCNSSYWHY